MDSAALLDLSETISMRQPDAIVGSEVVHGELTITTVPSELLSLISHLQEQGACRFTTLIDITAVDWPAREHRFEVVYHLLSMHLNQRIRVKVNVREGSLVPSVTGIFKSADWYEREVFDMYGILFSGHPDLRRILTDYGFRGHPLRKDFPTTGYVEVRYDEEAKRVVYEPVTLVQEYRQFDFMSPWEGAEYILPGDEKKEGK